MKTLTLTGSILMTAIILIFAFQNIQAICTDITFFFFELNTSIAPTFMFFFIAFVGIIAGAFYAAFMFTLMNSKAEDEESM